MNINMNGSMFGIFGEPETYSMKIWVGDTIVDNRVLKLPPPIAKQHFEQATQQIIGDKRPMKLEFSFKTNVVGSDNIDYLTFTNKVWDKAHKESKENG